MNKSGLTKFKQAVWHIRNKFKSKALILLYHRIADIPSDPQLLCVTPEHFIEHLEVLRKFSYPLELQQLIEAHRDKKIPDQSVVITFDDGYADNLYNAKSLLESSDIPATVFVTTNKIESKSEFWWDKLEYIFLSERKLLNSKLEVIVKGKPYSWNIGVKDENGYRKAKWNVLMDCKPASIQSVYKDLAAIMTNLKDEERESLIKQLMIWADIEEVCREDYRSMSSDELRSMVSGGLIEIGAHTLTHTALSILDKETQNREIENSKKQLESILEKPVLSFSYPFGRINDFTSDTIQIVQNAGFNCALANFPALITQNTHLFKLPRYVVRDCDGYEFTQRLKQILY